MAREATRLERDESSHAASSSRLEPRAEATLRRIRRYSQLLDAAWRVPGTDFRIGYDSLIGLLPGVGDLIGAGLSLYLIGEAARLGLPRRTLARMVLNAGFEAVLGSIPLVGDAFDAIFKANLRNLRLIERAIERA